jgi:phage-related minor tail protein
MEAMRGATEAAAASEDVMAASEITAEAAGAPLILILGGIALAVAALVAVGYVLYRNWNTIWAGIKAVAKDVWDWIVGHWPLLLTILLGPIGLAAAEIIKHFSTIKQWAQDVWNWIVAAWHFLYNYLVAPFITALGWFASAWQAIYRFIVTPISTAVGWISGAINTVIGWFDPSKLLAGFDKITGIITAPFRAAFDAIADLWNGTVGSLSFHVPNWVPLIGGKGFDVPKIPKLAQGGLITKEGLVYAHAGEAIIPAPARTGPAVHIEHATFSSQLDIETFMRKTAWYLQTQRV